jgi:hypothetical protein
MTLPSNEELKARVTKADPSIEQQLNNLKASLKQAYRAVNKANRKSRQINKKYYDRHAKLRSFRIGDYVYLHNPARKPGLSRKFHKCWVGPYKVTAKISELNYKILGKNDRKQVVHINRLKPAYGYRAQESKARLPNKKRARGLPSTNQNSDEQSAIKIGAFPLAAEVSSAFPNQLASACGSSHHAQPDSPLSEQRDPTYIPGNSPRSRREMRETCQDPPVTRSRTKTVL